MSSAGISHGAVTRVFDFLTHDPTVMPLNVRDSVSLVDSFAQGGIKFALGTVGNGSLDMADNGVLPADLIAVEWLVKLEAIDVNSDIRIGVSGAHNADPDVIAQSAWFKIKGASGSDAHTVSIETDDATLDINDEATAKTLVINAWTRFRIDFKTGIQSISSPGTSKGGLGSVQFSMGRTSQSNMFMSKIAPTKHMDMNAISATALLQPMCHFVQATATASPTTDLIIKSVKLEYRTH